MVAFHNNGQAIYEIDLIMYYSYLNHNSGNFFLLITHLAEG
jgi:hypothetical protein